MNLTIARSLTLFGILVGSGVALAIGLQTYAFDRLRVNGPVYQQIVYGKDLVADILPPPLFVVEAYLLATEGAYHPEAASGNLAKIADLKKSYDERKAYWPGTGLASDLKAQLKEQLEPTADAFWTILAGRYASAVTSGNADEVKAATVALKAAFERHQANVLQLVAKANDFLAAAERQASAETTGLTLISLCAAGSALLLLGAGLYLLHRRAVRPLNGMRDYMSILAKGDYSQPVPFHDRADEIGEMAGAVTVFRENALERIAARKKQEEAREQAMQAERDDMERKAGEDAARAKVIATLAASLESLSRGDLTIRIEDRFAPDYEMLREQFNGSVQSLEQALLSIAVAMQTVQSGVCDISTGTDDLSRRTEAQAASLEEAASALSQITVTLRATTERAQEADRQMAESRRGAERSTTIVRDAVAAMGKIEESSTQIRQIIGVIDEIAFQTNLLALNAGVEAARAGEAGKGFAVVAMEVRELASRSANAAREIRQLIDVSNTQVGLGVGLVNRTGDALTEMEHQMEQVGTLIDAIVQSARDQSRALDEVSDAVGQMDQVTQKNAAMAEEANAACRDLETCARDLGSQLGRFRTVSTRSQQGFRLAS
ncbi:methyl-accepting chemotaxis protein [Rhizobium sp. RU35A]|uniref:methyl-accepting chemotaxis protein n=1 Tax=Rhizobium sp. RU35A TaxID=1907414 RepID=UPI0009567C79|nr:methyl-accepting chemotaxis protein [Rhizobium sp. RU35A]SIQ77982.1 methyl-accepting chemotaxis protein [Rhizobium sp. RU35A]